MNKISEDLFLNKRFVIIALLVILVSGLILRLYNLDFQSLWSDELSTIRRSNYPDLATVIEKGINVHPPGHHILYWVVLKLFGDSAIALRIPAVIAGVLSIFLMFLVSKRIYSAKEGLISASFIAFFWCPIYYSQEARPYSLLLMFTLLSCWLLIKVIDKNRAKEKGQLLFSIIFILSATATCNLHYFGLLVIGILLIAALVFAIKYKSLLIKILLLSLIVAIGFAPWIPYMLDHLYSGPVYITKPSFIDFIYFFESLFNWSEKLTKMVFGLYCLLLFIIIIKVIKSKTYINPYKLLFTKEVFLGLWLIVPFILVYIKSVYSVPVLTYKNLIISLPPAFILLSRSITIIRMKPAIHYIIALIVVGLFIGNLFFYQKYYTTPTKNQFREAVNYIVENDKDLNNSVIIGFAWGESYFNYYFDHFDYPKQVEILAGEIGDINIANNYISRKNPDHIWYISGHRKPEEGFLNNLKENMAVVDSNLTFIGMQVWLFKR